jgi:hypothetical protein
MRTQYTVKFKSANATCYNKQVFSSLETAHNFYKMAISQGLQARIVKRG